MSRFKFTYLLWLFGVDVLINIASHFFSESVLELISKPLLMPILMVFVWVNAAQLKKSLIYLLEGALFFSWVGDVALLFDKEIPFLFMIGLGGFLVAHIQYIILFIKSSNKTNLKTGIAPFAVILFVGFTAYLIHQLWPHLGELQIPVFVYATVLMLMGVAAVSRVIEVGKTTVLLGAVLFVVSDSILAINKFIEPVEFGRVLIMFTYTMAQLLIVIGILKGLETQEND